MESHLTAEISASAVRHNLALLRERVGPATRLCAVVKADAYGLGLPLLLDAICQQADALAVATAPEAIQLRELGCEKPVLMLFSAGACADGDGPASGLAELIRRRVTLTVVAPEELAAVAKAARRAGAEAAVHVKVDTGMGRSGVLPEDAPALVDRARREAGVRLEGLYTHFASADEADKSSARRQLARFLDVAERAGGRERLTLHAANSAAAIDLPEGRLDMVRPGIAVYGCQPSDQMHTKLPLRPALRLTGRLMQRKLLPAGHKCGYGLTYTFPAETPIGLVPVGYADGYPRDLSNRSVMRIRGRDVPVRGRVSMDQVIVELTAVPDAAVGDEVEVISNDPAAPHSVEALARLCGTIPYELTCRLGARARRVLVD